MVNLKEVWELQNYIGSFHKYTMVINSLIVFFYLLRHPSLYFNIYNISNRSSILLSIGYLVMPLYYSFESYTTLKLCQAYVHYSCKFIIHHLLTISLSITVFQHSFFNFFTLITPAVHGFMNIGYYYNPEIEYIMCR